jgi:hypothetical protein
LVVPRLRYFQSLSQHRRLAQYIQPEPNEALASSHWNCLGKPWHLSICGLLKDLECEPLSSASRALWPAGVRLLPHGALGAPSPRCTWRRPRYAQKNLVRACASSPEISRGGHHGILPSNHPQPQRQTSSAHERGPGLPLALELIAYLLQLLELLAALLLTAFYLRSALCLL